VVWSPQVDRPAVQALSSQIDTGVKLAIAQSLERHRKLGESISVWQDGKVLTLTAEEIPQPPSNPQS
jgi:hypothetical protein